RGAHPFPSRGHLVLVCLGRSSRPQARDVLPHGRGRRRRVEARRRDGGGPLVPPAGRAPAGELYERTGRPSSRGREPRRLGSALVDAVLGILAGFVSGVMSGAFGVGGAILT